MSDAEGGHSENENENRDHRADVAMLMTMTTMTTMTIVSMIVQPLLYGRNLPAGIALSPDRCLLLLQKGGSLPTKCESGLVLSRQCCSICDAFPHINSRVRQYHSAGQYVISMPSDALAVCLISYLHYQYRDRTHHANTSLSCPNLNPAGGFHATC